MCAFDCIYCQLGKTNVFTNERRVFVPVTKIIEELDLLPPVQIDYITFSGMGEPTLAENLGQMIKAIKKIRNEKIAVLTNSSLLNENGENVEVSAKGLLARVLQHEIDHLKGKLIIDYMKFLEKIEFKVKKRRGSYANL
ncbi:MAG: peptide deformylase [Candidatus Omnitrophica bacterium]|nr:peptide deformylase [Candidatus Omnitrophota bacterium]